MFWCCFPTKNSVLTAEPTIPGAGPIVTRKPDSVSPIITTLGSEPEEPVINTYVEEKK